MSTHHGATFEDRHASSQYLAVDRDRLLRKSDNYSGSTLTRGRGRELSRDELDNITASIVGDDEFLERSPKPPANPAWCCKSWPTIKRTMIRLFLPVGMLFFVVFGALVPEPGDGINKIGWDGVSHASDFCIAIIFFISGLKLANDEVMSALQQWPAMVYGIVFIIGLSPWLGAGFAAINITHHPSNFPTEFVLALTVFLATPTTVTSCVVLTAEAYGNKSLAMMLTTICNFVGVFTLPLILPIALKTSSDPGVTDGGDVQQAELIENLVETLFIPLFIGKTLLEMSPLVRQFARNWNTVLKVISNSALVVIIWMNASTNADQLRRVSAVSVVICLFLGILAHLILLVVNYVVSKYIMRVPEPEMKALVMVCSQKSEVISLAVLPRLPPAFGDPGLLTIGFLIVYLPMLVIDGFIAYYWAKEYDFRKKVENQEDLLRSVEEENAFSGKGKDEGVYTKLRGDSSRLSFNVESEEKEFDV